MKRIFIPITYDCNDNCISCPVPRKQTRENPLLKDIKKDIDEILSYSNQIIINGGEPSLNKNLIKILKYINAKKPKKIELLTNCEFFYYKNYVKKIKNIRNLKIITTIYGHDYKIHDSITRTPGSFKHKINGIKNLIKNNVQIELRILLHKMNYRNFVDITDFLIKNFNKNDFEKIVIMNPKLTAEARKNKQAVAIKLTELSKILEKPIKKLIDNSYKIEIYHFPHCVLPETLWKYSKGVTADEGEVIFIEKCEKCSKKNICSKIWKSYLDIFSMEEFNPIKEKKSYVEKKLKKINSISHKDKFYQDKLFFLLDLKQVLRIQKNKNETFAEAIKGLEDFKYCLHENYIFISKNFKKAQLAEELTKKLNMKNINPKESAKFNFQLGELYGYPPCCAKNFPNINARNTIKEKEMSHQTEFKYKNRKFHLPYYPCSENCEKTKKFKSLFKLKLKKLDLFQNEN